MGVGQRNDTDTCDYIQSAGVVSGVCVTTQKVKNKSKKCKLKIVTNFRGEDLFIDFNYTNQSQ